MKALKIGLISIFSLLIILYAGFLFILPFAINLDKFAPEISKQVENASKFKLNLKDLSLKTSWKLTLGVKVKKADIISPSNVKIAQANDFNINISLLPFLFKQIKIDSINLDKLMVRLYVDSNGKFDLEKDINNIISGQQNQTASSEMPFGIRFSEAMPDINLKDYKISFIEKGTNKIYSLEGKDFKISDFVLNKKIKISTEGALSFQNRKQIKYNFDIFNKYFPEIATTTEQAQPIEFNIIDIFNNIHKYNLCADINADLKIDGKNEDIKIDGDFDLDDILLTLKGKTLPKSNIDLDFSGNKTKINSNLYTDIDEEITVRGKFINGKRRLIDLNVKSDRTDLDDAVVILDTIAQMFGVKDLEQINANGYFTADFNLKSNFKKIKSDGFLKVNNANIIYKLYNVGLKSINADIDFSDDKIKIKKANANLNGSPISIKGYVDSSSYADLSVLAENIQVKGLLATLGQKQILKENSINSGLINIVASFKGKFEKAKPKVDIKLTNLNLKNIPNKAYISLPLANINVSSNGKNIDGNVLIQGLKITSQMPMITVPKASIVFDEKDLKIDNSALYLNSSKIDILGGIRDYNSKRANVNLTARGKILSNDLKMFLPKEFRSGVNAIGKIPFIAKVSGNQQVQSIQAQAMANNSNYVSVFDINSLRGKTSLLNFSGSLSGFDFKIEDISLNSLSQNKGLSENFKSNLSSVSKVVYIGGKVSDLYGKNPNLHGINIHIPQQISTSIPGFNNSSAIINKGNLSINGRVNNPTVSGNINILRVLIPAMKTEMNSTTVSFAKNSINVNCSKLALADNVMSFKSNINNNFSKGIIINNVDFNGQNINLDTLGAVFNAMPQANAAPGTDLGITVLSGKGYVNNFKTGGMQASNISTDFNLKNNVLYLKNLTGNAYTGNVAGDINYNLLYSNIGINMQGRNLSAGPAIKGLTGMPDVPLGKLDFDANVTMRGYSDFDIIKSLKGKTDFIISNGQMGKLGQLEHLLYAQNLLSNNIFRTTLGAVTKFITAKNTGSFKYIKGKMTFNNAWADIDFIKTSGPSMSMYITGKYNLLNNSANMVVLGRLSNDVVQLLGPIGEFSFDKMISSIPKIGAITSALVNQITTNPNNENVGMIPQLTPKTSLPTKEFKVIFNGGIQSQSSVKSFKWLSKPTVATSSQTAIPTSINDVKQTLQNQAQQTVQKYIPKLPTTTTTTNTKTTTPTLNLPKKVVPVADFINSLPDLR